MKIPDVATASLSLSAAGKGESVFVSGEKSSDRPTPIFLKALD